MLHHVQNAFNAGEISPYVSARPELEVYQSGCKRMENFIALPYGGARYRAGNEFIARTKNDGVACLYGFEFSTDQRHVLEFGEGYIRFFQTGLDTAVPIMNGGSPLEVVSPYFASELRELQFAQLNDVVIITHENHPPYRLSRFASDDWTMEEFPIRRFPLLEPELDEAKAITASATDGSVTLTSNEDIFKSGHVGAQFELSYRRTDEEITQEVDIAADTTSLVVKDARTGGTTTRTGLKLSTALRVDGEFTLQTFGTWTATIEVFRRFLGETNYEQYLRFTGSNDRNLNELYSIDESAEILIAVSDHTSSTNARALISVSDPFIRGKVEITSVADAQSATATVLTQLADGATTAWAESAFSTLRGFPRGVTFHGQRLWFGGTEGGTKSRPQTLWASRIDGFDDFEEPFGVDSASDADAPLALPVFAEQYNRIQWLSSNRSLLVGTSAGEFVVTGETNEESVSIGNYNVRRHTSNGSSAYQALPVDSSAIFIQRQGRKLRKMGYRIEQDAYGTDDLTIYSEHLTRGNIVELVYQRQRDPVIWGVTEDGKLIGWTYRPEQPFLAAYEITSPGATFESLAVTYGDGDEDEFWQIVNRNGVRCIERTRPDQILAQETADLDKLWFLDSAIEYTGPTTTCTGLEHLEGQEVQLFADGAYAGKATVTGGQITNTEPTASRTIVGIHYGGELETMNIEVPTEGGSSQGRMKQCGRSVIRLFKSVTGEWFTSQNSQAHAFRSLTPQQAINIARPIDDFDQVLESHPGQTRTLSIGVRQTHPYPLTVLSISARITLTEDA